MRVYSNREGVSLVKGAFQNACHWMHEEAGPAGHWLKDHLLHDRRVWIGLAILAAIVLLALAFVLGSGGTPSVPLRYDAYPHHMHW